MHFFYHEYTIFVDVNINCIDKAKTTNPTIFPPDRSTYWQMPCDYI